MKLVDTHAHLTDPKLAPEAGAVVQRAREAGVEWLVTIASDLPDSERTVALADRFSEVFATVGVHPHAAATVDDSTFPRLRELAAHPRVVAIGETGLDFHYDNSPREEQRESFRSHLEVAADLDLPAIVHSRTADEDTAAILREVGWGRGVLHCFSSGEGLLETALDLGWYISFAGMITFPSWRDEALLQRVPADRLLIETDSPYLAPVPHRGRRNEPAHVALVAARAAAIRGAPVEALARATSENARHFYRVDPA